MSTNRVLVIDDEWIVLQSVGKILRAEGFDVEVASSGREGLERALRDAYDMVITDIRMPDIGGMRILRDVKRARPAVPVVMITGFASVKSAVQAMKLGATEYLEKPFTPDELTRTVKKALNIAATAPAEDQHLVHKEAVLRVLEQAATDHELVYNMLHYGADALDGFDLSGPEKLAILTADIQWLEQNVGPLTAPQRRWLDQRLNSEIW